jgi:hypothetical protein
MAVIRTYSVFRKGKGKTVLTGDDKLEAERVERGELFRCPKCGTALERGARKCQSCGALLDAGGAVTGIERLTDGELTARLREFSTVATKKSAKYSIGMPLFFVGLGGGVLLSMAGLVVIGIPLIIAGIIGMIIAYPDMKKRSKGIAAIQNDVRNAVILPALESVFDEVSYEKSGRIPDKRLNQGNMIPSLHWNTIEGSDHVRAKYKGIEVEFSDITLSDVPPDDDEIHEPGAIVLNKKEPIVVFKGMWLICDFGRELTADLVLTEKTSKYARRKSDVETENAEFNNKFTIETKSPHDAFYILTPHMMEFIVQMDTRAAGDTFMNFSRDGKVHIAVNSNRDAFEVNWKTVVDHLDETRQHIIEEIRYITDIIDELRITDSMFIK